MMRGGGGGALMRSLRCSSILRHRSRQLATDAAVQSQSSSSSSSSSSPFVSRLRTILRDEIQYQYDYAPPHQPVTKFERFVVEDLPGQQMITLRAKSPEDENIRIEATMFDGSILAPKSGDEGTEEVVQLHISLLVDIWKGGQETDSMEFLCSAWPNSLEIQKAYIFKRDNSPALPYMGPDIKNISGGLRSGFYKFLNDRGINGELSRFLHQYMMNKDRIELIHWLGKVQAYIEQ